MRRSGVRRKTAAVPRRSIDRALLEDAWLRLEGERFAEALAGMPNVGEDHDFERVEGPIGRGRVFA